MPESHKAERRRIQKANRAAGIGDENGRIPARVKAEAIMLKCAVCQQELKVTKTNTELKRHAESKHGKTVEDCFPGATKMAEELAAATAKGGGKGGKKGPELTKAQRKKQAADGLDDLLSAGLSGGKKKGKK